MAAKRIDIVDIRQLLQLKNKGLSNRKIAKTIGLHRNSVKHYVRLFKASGKSYESLLLIPDEGLLELFPIPSITDKNKYEDLSSYFSYFHSELKKPGCTRQVLWNEYLCKHPQGYGYTQFNLHFNRWLKQVKGSRKIEHKAGDKVYIDYSDKKLSYVESVS